MTSPKDESLSFITTVGRKKMFKDSFANVVSTEARECSKSLVARALQNHAGKPITEEVVRDILVPYCDQVKAKVPADLVPYIKDILNKLAPHAVEQVRTNVHMNNVGKSESLLDALWAEAILVAFANALCYHQCIDLGMYTCDLHY